MAYVYRFVDNLNNIIYVGYTGRDLSKRIDEHFKRGHLPNECYSSVSVIEYKAYSNCSDGVVMEGYYINKYKPRFNKVNKANDSMKIDIEDNQKWKIYKRFNVSSPACDSRLIVLLIEAGIGTLVAYTIFKIICLLLI